MVSISIILYIFSSHNETAVKPARVFWQEEENMRNWWLGSIYLSAAASIWGGMYVVSKMVLYAMPPWVLSEMCFVISLCVVGVWAFLAREWKIARRDVKEMALLGLIGYTYSIGMQFVGTDLSGAASGALITSAFPAFISVFTWSTLREKTNLRQGTALAITIVGIFIVIGLPFENFTSFAGHLFLFSAAITWAMYTVFHRGLALKYSSLAVTFWSNLFGVIFTFPISWWEWHAKGGTWPTDRGIWLGILYLGIISVALAFYLWNKGFEYIDTSVGSPVFIFQPVVGMLLGVWLLNEKLTWNFYPGAFLIITGVVLLSMDKTKKETTKTAP
jgi:drug/metabolite transporter (DMT)-like permease